MMWPRKQLDVGWTDLAYGLVQAITARTKPTAANVVGAGWVPADEALVTLSVRTGWDLLLAALQLPPGSEVITSAVTIPDMVRIIEQHKLVPVPVDVDGATLEVDIDQLERLITPRTRAILVAHLFGGRAEMGPIIELARRHDLLVIEDCAQAFVGQEYAGHDESDCVLFSFGPIKTATALGGAVVRVRDAALRERMAELHSAYPVQRRSAYMKRLAKYAAFRLLSLPRVYGHAVQMLTRMGKDYDRALGNAAHSFGASEFFTQIRRQPCVPLVRMLARRVTMFDRRGAARLGRRAARGHDLAQVLRAGMVVGNQNPTHTFWVTPVRIGNREAVITALRAAGFDATKLSSLIVVPGGRELPGEARPAAWLGEIIFLPSGDDIPEKEWQRQVLIVRQLAVPAAPLAARRELAELSGVSGAS
jgi:dTDP-4-amino-4,6-dideoxygalactose transaminase